MARQGQKGDLVKNTIGRAIHEQYARCARAHDRRSRALFIYFALCSSKNIRKINDVRAILHAGHDASESINIICANHTQQQTAKIRVLYTWMICAIADN